MNDKVKNVSTFVDLLQLIERMKKIYLPLWLLGCLVCIMSSCLGDMDEYDDWILSNCLISSFKLQSDSIPDLENVIFTIDQINGLIYNKDSMPYGTEINWLVVCTVTFEIDPSAVEVYQAATGDSLTWNRSDSLDFSDYVRFDIYSSDQKATKRYITKLNIHQQAPDSMVWTNFSNRLLGKTVQEQKVIEWNNYFWMYVKVGSGYELYRSPVTDRKTWIPVSLTGLDGKTLIISQITEYEGCLYLQASDGTLYRSTNGSDWNTMPEETPVVRVLLGVINSNEQRKTSPVLTTIIQEDNTWYFAAMDTGNQWEKGVEVPAEFPVSGFGNSSYESMFYWHLMVAAGKDRYARLSDVVWETMTGLSWVRLTDERKSWFEKREGVMLTQYDGNLFLIGGFNASNEATKDIYISQDKGISWALADSMIVFPETFKARGHASVWVDQDNFLLLFGGKENNSANILDELWSGRLNRLGFKD